MRPTEAPHDRPTATDTPPPRAAIARAPSRRLRGWAAAALVGLLAACGGGGGGGDSGGGPPPVGGPDYFPLALGDRWITRESSTVGQIVTRVTDVQASGGGQAVTLTQFTADGQRTEIRLRRDADGIYLLPGADAPPYLRNLGPLLQMKLPLREGETTPQITAALVDLGEDLDGDGRSETAQISSSITVVGLVPVTLPEIGTLTNVAHLRTTLTLAVTLSLSGQTESVVTRADDYYAPDIGPVRSVVTIDGLGQVLSEEALGYAVGPRRSETRRPLPVLQTPQPGSTVQPAATIEVFFDEVLDAYGLEIAPPVLRRADGLVAPGRFVLTDGQRLTFIADGPVPSGTYTVLFGEGVTDLYGNPPDMPPWTFTLDGDAPRLVTASLANGATGVPLDAEILVTFSEPVVPEVAGFTLDTLGFSGGYNLVPEVASGDGRTLRLVRTVPLNYATTYRLTITPDLRDPVGNRLGAPVVIDFTTEAGRFAAATPLPLASPVVASQVADLTGDGRGDLLVATRFAGAPESDLRLLLYPAQPDGSLGTPRELPAEAAADCPVVALAVADLDADGRQDVLAQRGDCGLRLLRQAGDGSFVVAWDDASLRMEQLADVDGDGRPDLVTRVLDMVRLHRGLAGGGFGPAVEHPLGGARQIDIADLDGDGRADIVGAGDGLWLIRQRPDGGFAAPETLALAPEARAGGVAAGDLDGDGRADLVYALSTAGDNGRLAWRLQRPDGSLGPEQQLPSPTRPSVVRLADLDGDGRLDVVMALDGTGLLAVFMQRSDGTLAPYEYHVVPAIAFPTPGQLTIGDFSGDGRPDVLLGNSVLRQHPPQGTGARRSPQAAAGTTTAPPPAKGASAALRAALEALRRPAPAAPGGT
jgi:hypothetical protein